MRKGASEDNHRVVAMQALVGMWKDRKDLRDSAAYVRRLRRQKRLKRLAR